MAKITLNPAPTFKANALIPVHGGEPVPVEFTFKHRPRKALQEWLTAAEEQSEAQAIMDMANAWELEEEFNAANIEQFCENYAGASRAIMEAYLKELSGLRKGN